MSEAVSLVLILSLLNLNSLVLDSCSQDDVPSDENLSDEIDESKLPLQLAIVGRPNVGKSTLLNSLLEEERVLVGPEAGLTRDAVRVQFEFQDRTVYLVRLKFLIVRLKFLVVLLLLRNLGHAFDLIHFVCFKVDTAGWLERTDRDKGPASLSIMQSRKSLMRAHVIALVLDAEEVCYIQSYVIAVERINRCLPYVLYLQSPDH